MDSLSLDAAEAMTATSSRTLRRYLAEGTVASDGRRDARGRATMALADALRLAAERSRIALGAEDAQLLLHADAGNAAAQTGMGALLFLQGAQSPARYWLELAAQQDDAEAMHWLALLHAAGLCEGDGNAQALMWLARAAAQGHVIAKAQLAGLMPGAGATARGE